MTCPILTILASEVDFNIGSLYRNQTARKLDQDSDISTTLARLTGQCIINADLTSITGAATVAENQSSATVHLLVPAEGTHFHLVTVKIEKAFIEKKVNILDTVRESEVRTDMIDKQFELREGEERATHEHEKEALCRQRIEEES